MLFSGLSWEGINSFKSSRGQGVLSPKYTPIACLTFHLILKTAQLEFKFFSIELNFISSKVGVGGSRCLNINAVLLILWGQMFQKFYCDRHVRIRLNLNFAVNAANAPILAHLSGPRLQPSREPYIYIFFYQDSTCKLRLSIWPWLCGFSHYYPHFLKSYSKQNSNA